MVGSLNLSRLVVQTLADPADAVDPRVDLVELRLDLYPDLDPAAWIASAPKPVVATVRRRADGGRWEGTEEGRGTLLRAASNAAWIDLESDADPAFAPKGPRRIVSHHDCSGMPGDLAAVYARCAALGGDRIKIAVTPPDATEALRLLDLPEPGLGMGADGRFTRFLAPLTYCALRPLAPGMPTPDEFYEVFRIARLGPRPALLGVAGDPVGHSASPQLHNPSLEREGLDAVYLRFRVSRLASFWPAFLNRGGRALSITAPLKEEAARLATRPAPEVLECGAANTLLSDGRAFNTDYAAFLELAPRPPSEALVMGAGGSARAALAALRRLGYRVRVWARREEAAGALGAEVVGTPVRHPLVVNTTPAQPPPCDFLIDLRYGPGSTPLTGAGVDGRAFLEAQARPQRQIFLEHLRGG